MPEDNLTDEALFGSGLPPDDEVDGITQGQPQLLYTPFSVRTESPSVRMREIQVTGDLVDGPASSSSPVTPQSRLQDTTAAAADTISDHRRGVVEVSGSPGLGLASLARRPTSVEIGGARPREGLEPSRDQGARKKSLKNKENIDKNSGRSITQSQANGRNMAQTNFNVPSGSTTSENSPVVNKLLARGSNSNPNNFQPKLQVKRYDNDVICPQKKVLNSDKDRKQSQNIALNGNGISSSRLRYANDSPDQDADLSFQPVHTCSPSCKHVNDSPVYNIEDIEEDQSELFGSGRQTSGSSRSSFRPVIHIKNSLTSENFASVHKDIPDLRTEEEETDDTPVKAVQSNGIKRIQNNLWESSDEKGAENNRNVTRITLDKSNLNQSMVNDIEADGHHVSQSLYVKLENQSDHNSPIENPQTSPIVVSYDQNRHNIRPINGVQVQRGENTSPFVPVSESPTNNDSVRTYDSLQSTYLFGDGETDSMLAHRLQQQYNREMEDPYPYSYDISPEPHYYSRCGELDSYMSRPDVLNQSVEILHNDLYNPGEHYESGDETQEGRGDAIRVRFGTEEAEDQIERTVPEPLHVAIPDPVHIQYGEGDSDDPGEPSLLVLPSSIQGEDADDETVARRLQEAYDEQIARQLQATEAGSPGMIDERPVYSHHPHLVSDDLSEDPDLPEHHQDYRNTWQYRPLTVRRSPRIRNVPDSRGYNTWNRPLQHRNQGYQFRGHYPYDSLTYLDNIHPEEEGYDIPPPNVADYYLPYGGGEMYGDDRLISINRDPHLLVSLLMDRDPDIRIPDNIDLNDYEALWELAENLGEVRRVGMDESEISILPVYVYKASETASESYSKTTECNVCLCEFVDGEQLRTLPCCHSYHVPCIDEWLKRNAICPVCRQPAIQRD